MGAKSGAYVFPRTWPRQRSPLPRPRQPTAGHFFGKVAQVPEKDGNDLEWSNVGRSYRFMAGWYLLPSFAIAMLVALSQFL